MLVALSPKKPWEFLAAVSQAWEWTQARPRFYQHSGALMTFDEFLVFSKAENKKQIAVMNNGQMVALITVWLMTDGVFDVHVVAPKRSSAALLTRTLLTVRDGIFDDLHADVIRTSCGTYRGHKHKGIERILLACGMSPIGKPWRVKGDSAAMFQEYEITRETYAKSKASTNERLPIQTEAVLGGTGSAECVESAG